MPLKEVTSGTKIPLCVTLRSSAPQPPPPVILVSSLFQLLPPHTKPSSIASWGRVYLLVSPCPVLPSEPDQTPLPELTTPLHSPSLIRSSASFTHPPAAPLVLSLVSFASLLLSVESCCQQFHHLPFRTAPSTLHMTRTCASSLSFDSNR